MFAHPADMKVIILFDGITFKAFNIKSGCVLAPTLCGIIFVVLLDNAYGLATGGIYLKTRSDEKLFRLKQKFRQSVREAFYLQTMLQSPLILLETCSN